jgi:hypothetical protein
MTEQKTYLLFSSMPKFVRITLTLLILLIGFSLQLRDHLIIGSRCIIFASLLNILRMAHIKAKSVATQDWARVTFEEFNKAVERIKSMKKWEGFSTGGRITLVVVVTFLGFFILPAMAAIFSTFMVLLLVDFYLLFVPLFISGSRSAWIPENLELKINTLLRVCQLEFIRTHPNIKIQPYLLIGKEKTNSNFPLDTRLIIEFPKASKDFIGVQVQVSINKVGSTAYPYAYAVIIAKRTMNLPMKDKFSADKNIVYEYKVQDEMDILVIRQFTTRTSGYNTNDKVIAAIVSQAVGTSLQLLYDKSQQPGKSA